MFGIISIKAAEKINIMLITISFLSTLDELDVFLIFWTLINIGLKHCVKVLQLSDLLYTCRCTFHELCEMLGEHTLDKVCPVTKLNRS